MGRFGPLSPPAIGARRRRSHLPFSEELSPELEDALPAIVDQIAGLIEKR